MELGKEEPAAQAQWRPLPENSPPHRRPARPPAGERSAASAEEREPLEIEEEERVGRANRREGMEQFQTPPRERLPEEVTRQLVEEPTSQWRS
jgi:hypothetical protein